MADDERDQLVNLALGASERRSALARELVALRNRVDALEREVCDLMKVQVKP